jgi:hypothetical protein
LNSAFWLEMEVDVVCFVEEWYTELGIVIVVDAFV